MDEIPIMVKAEEHGQMDDTLQPLYTESGKHPGWMQLKSKSVQIPRSDNPSLFHYYSAEDVAGLKSAHAKEKESARNLKEKVSQFEGVDITSLKGFEKKYNDLLKKGGNGDHETIIKSAKEELERLHTEKESKWTKREQKLVDQIKQLMITDRAKSAILKHKGNIDLLLPHVVGLIDLVEEDGNFDTRIKNPDGKGYRVTMKSGSDQTYMQPEELVGTMKSVDGFTVAFDGTGASGSGSSGSDRTGGSKGSIRLTRDQMRDVSAYRKAKVESEKTGRPIELIE